MAIGPIVTYFVVGTEGRELRHQGRLEAVRDALLQHFENRGYRKHVVITNVQTRIEGGVQYLVFWVCTARRDITHVMEGALKVAESANVADATIQVGTLLTVNQPELREQFRRKKK